MLLMHGVTMKFIRANWFKVIHDIFPTNERHTIRLTSSALWTTCGEGDSIMHRIRECDKGREIWERTRKPIAWVFYYYYY